MPSQSAVTVLSLPPGTQTEQRAATHTVSVQDFLLSGVSLRQESYKGEQALEIKMPSNAYQDPSKEALKDRNFMAWLPLDFQNGTIEATIASDLAPDAPGYARGFVGLAFRIDNERFEKIYLRPTNSQSEDQVRRNRSVQYAAYPEHTFDQLRIHSPGKYETYAEIELNRWIHMKLEIIDNAAKLWLNHNVKPALIVDDLKLGTSQRGGVGLWIESGTIAHCKELRVTGL
jgi:hypothetical protein